MENDKNLEQPESELTTDSPEASKILDRFSSVQDLKKAYKNLRAEFTRKSQRLSELEQQNTDGLQSKTVMQENAETAGAGAADKNAEKITQTPLIQNQEPVEHRDNSKIIEEYLISLASLKKAPAVIANANTDFVPASQAKSKSINSITKEAEEFFIRRQL